MRLLTAGLVIKRPELLDEVERCCQELANHLIVEKHDCSNWAALLAWLEQTRPQVLLVDAEHFQNIVEERVREIKKASPDSMIIAIHDAADSQMIIAGDFITRLQREQCRYPRHRPRTSGAVSGFRPVAG